MHHSLFWLDVTLCRPTMWTVQQIMFCVEGGHFCDIAGVLAHLISSPIQLEQENILNSLKRYPKTSWPSHSRVKTFREE